MNGEQQPRCRNCGHRRIHHYLLIGYKGRKGGETEMTVPCSIFTNRELDRCGCDRYVPMLGLRAI